VLQKQDHHTRKRNLPVLLQNKTYNTGNVSHFLIYRNFFSLCLLPFFVPLSILFARKFCLPESLFFDKNSNESLFLYKNSNQIDLLILNLIIFILCNCSSIGWVAVAVAGGGVRGGRRCSAGGPKDCNASSV
jgi:hypothetical protein